MRGLESFGDSNKQQEFEKITEKNVWGWSGAEYVCLEGRYARSNARKRKCNSRRFPEWKGKNF